MAILSFAQRAELASNAPTSVLQAVAQGNPPPAPYDSATDLIGQLTAGAELGIRNRFTEQKAVQDQIEAQEEKNRELGLPPTPQPDILSQIVAKSQQGQGVPGQGMQGQGMQGAVQTASYGGLIGLQDGGEAQGYSDPPPTIFRRGGIDYLINEMLSGMPGRESQDYEDWLADYDEWAEGIDTGVVPDWIGRGGLGRLKRLPEMVTKSLKNPYATPERVKDYLGNRAWLGETGRGGVLREIVERGVGRGRELVPIVRGVPARVRNPVDVVRRKPSTALVPRTPGTGVVHVPGRGSGASGGINFSRNKTWRDKLKEAFPWIAGTAGIAGLSTIAGDDEITDANNPRAMELVDKIMHDHRLKAAEAEIARMATPGTGRDGGQGLDDILGPIDARSQEALDAYESGMREIQTNLTTKTAGDLEYDKQSKAFVDTLGGFVTSPEDLKSDTLNIALDSLAQALVGSDANRRGSVTGGLEGTLERMMAHEDTVSRKNLELENMMASTNIGMAERDSAISHAGDAVMAPVWAAQVSESGQNYRQALDAFSRVQAAQAQARAASQWSASDLETMRQEANILALETMGLSDVPEEQDNRYDEYNVWFRGILEQMMGEQGSLGGTGGITSLPGASGPGASGPGQAESGDFTSFADTIRQHEKFEITPYIDWSKDSDGEWVNTGLAIGLGQKQYWPPTGPPVTVTEDMDFTDEQLLASADRQLREQMLPGLIRLLPAGAWNQLPPSAQAQLVSVVWNYGVNHKDFRGNRPIAVALREGDWDAMGDAMRDLAGDNADLNYPRRMAEADAWDAAMARVGKRERETSINEWPYTLPSSKPIVSTVPGLPSIPRSSLDDPQLRHRFLKRN